jgi:hypothetical protein
MPLPADWKALRTQFDKAVNLILDGMREYKDVMRTVEHLKGSRRSRTTTRDGVPSWTIST